MADVITKLKVESTEYDSKLKRAIATLNESAEATKRAGVSFKGASEDAVKLAKSMGSVQTVATTSKGKLAELKNAYQELSVRYKQLTDEEKKSPFGKAMSQSVDQLRGRIKSLESDISAANSELNDSGKKGSNLSSVFGDLANKMGINLGPLQSLTAGNIGLAAKLGGVAAAAGLAAKSFYDYNAELKKQSQIVSVTTGLSGGDAGSMVADMRAISKVYDVDFRDGVNAANTLMTQFGVSSKEALGIVSDGLQGMVKDDAPQFLQLLQQYAPSFRDAGIGARELAAIINNTEGGIFTADGLAMIQMGAKNIRLMKDSVKKDLKDIGIDADEMQRKLSDGSMTTLDALKQIGENLKGLSPQSQELGQILQDVFGRQGANNGSLMVQTLSELNTNLDETKRQTGDVGIAMDNLKDATSRLESACQNLFGLTETGFANFGTNLKTAFYNAFSEALEYLNTLLDRVRYLKSEIGIAKQAGLSGTGTSDAESKLSALKGSGHKSEAYSGQLSTYDKQIAKLTQEYNKATELRKKLEKEHNNPVIASGDATSQSVSALLNSKREEVNARRALDAAMKNRSKYSKEGADIVNGKITTNTTSSTTTTSSASTKSGNGGSKEAKFETQKINSKGVEGSGVDLIANAFSIAAASANASIKDMESTLSALNSQFNNSTDQGERKALKSVIQATELRIDQMKKPGEWSIDENGVAIPLSFDIDTKALKQSADNFQKNLEGGVEGGKKVKASWTSVADAIGSAGSAMQNLGNKGFSIAGTIMQAIAQVVLGFATASAARANGAGGIFTWIPAIAAGLATMTATIATIKSQTKGSFAEGGIVGGSMFSGDNVPIMANSGEMVVTQAQQSSLWNFLQSNNKNNGNDVSAVGVRVTGESLYTCLDNHMRRTGKKLPS